MDGSGKMAGTKLCRQVSLLEMLTKQKLRVSRQTTVRELSTNE